MFDFLTLVIAIAALIFARRAFNRFADVLDQLAGLRARLEAVEVMGTRATAVPALRPSVFDPEQTLSASSPDIAPDPATSAEPAIEAPQPPAGGTAAAPPPLPADQP